jgi:hypothetical protein
MRPEHLFDRLASLGTKPSETDRADGFELAVSAHRFSRRTQAVIDDKLSFSATLMRAGEVEAANRLLAEVGEEVLTEEVALLERVNEVKAARSIRPKGHDRVTRGRLARTLAVAMLGASLLAFSAAGAAVVGLFRDGDQAAHGSDPDTAGSTAVALESDRSMRNRNVKLTDNISVSMTAEQFRKYSKLTAGDIDEDQLQNFLLELMPRKLAEKVHYALVAGMETVPEPIAQEVTVAASKLQSPRTSASDRKQAQPADDGSEETKEDQSSPEPSQTPDDEESPSPDESPEDQQSIPLFGGDDEEGS